MWQQQGAQAHAGEPVTAQVEQTTLTSQVRLNATLTYGDPVELPAGSGIITALPTAGSVIERGQQVYEAEGRPVVLFQGARPFWRPLSADSEPGTDVKQLEENLAALGFFSEEPDERFDWVTRQAVRDWQKSLGVSQTGAFSPADVVVTDAPGIRISQVTAALGDEGASPATYTETTLRAVAKLSAAQARELTADTPVRVVLPDGTEIEAALSEVDPGGQPIPGSDQSTSPTATIEFADQSEVAGSGPAAVRVIVGDATDQTETLVVPVTALLAVPDGGYAVEVLLRGEIVRTPVEVGLIADARAQVLASGSDIEGRSGPVLATGDQVVLSR